MSAEVVTESGHAVAPVRPTRPLEQYSLDAARASRAPMPQKAQPATTTPSPPQQPQPALQRQITLPSAHSQASPQLHGTKSFRQPAGGAAESPGAGAPGGRKKKAPMPDITSREWQHHIADSLLSARTPKQGHNNNTYSIKADFSASSPARRTPGAAASPAQAPRALSAPGAAAAPPFATRRTPGCGRRLTRPHLAARVTSSRQLPKRPVSMTLSHLLQPLGRIGGSAALRVWNIKRSG